MGKKYEIASANKLKVPQYFNASEALVTLGCKKLSGSECFIDNLCFDM